MSWADFIRVVHFLFVAFVVGGLGLIWIGAAARWRWVRNVKFRVTHLAAIGYVALQTALGYPCPLTIWEATLRPDVGAHAGFVERWINAMLYYDLPSWVFTVMHITFALLIVFTFWWIPPDRSTKA
ncbi:MAG: DUF2784 domain-containing protein [Burkholderiales bacterium]